MHARNAFNVLIMVAASLLSTLALAQQPDFDAVEFTSTDLGDGMYMIQGMGGNLGLSIGEDGVLLIDDDFAALAPKVLAAIAELTEAPVDFLINTHWHDDHAGGNASLGSRGAVIVAHDNVRTRMADQGVEKNPAIGLPVITFSQSATFHYNAHEIHAFHVGPAHTDGDAIIHFRDIDLIHAGDILFNGMYPFIDASSGGSVDGYISALEQLAAIAGPETKIIPGHGPLASRSDVEKSIAMLQGVKRAIMDLIADGKTLEQTKAADPLADYNDQWGWFFINGASMTEIMYNALSR